MKIFIAVPCMDQVPARFAQSLAMLKKAGVRVYSWGPDEYEKDTGLHHIACTLTWWQPPGAMEQFNKSAETEEQNNGE